jgi:3-hydroxyacyl-[acyl-carrier-protein] dehydratase
LKTLDIEEIKAILPHRYPFLLIDKVIDLEPGKRVVAIKNVTANEPFFQGHFPQRAIMPGVLVIESMAQAGGIMMLGLPEHKGKLAYIGTVDAAKFRRPIVPGDTLRVEVVLKRARGNTGKVECFAYVGDQVAAEAVIMFVLMKPLDTL